MPKRFNEFASPPATSTKVRILQILQNLKHNHPDAYKQILHDIDMTDTQVVDLYDRLMGEAEDNNEIEECGCCGSYHRPDFRGDCRNDDERFPRI